jgi:4-amino-4-deoxy-L-arabinose transferase-like glycosyltransferase
MPSELWLVATLMVVGGVLRFASLGSQSFWVDEATTYHEMSLSFGALLHAVHVNETTPPLYFVLVWLWAKVFGTSEAGLRSLSAVLGTGVIAITYYCGRELVSRWAGVVAAAFAALSPFMIWYSQEARSYMLFAAFSGLSVLFFARARRRGSIGDVVLWGVFSALAILTHFFAGFLVAPEAVWLLVINRSRAVLATVGVVAAVQAALLPLAAGDTTHPLQWIKAFPLSVRIKQVPVDLGLGTLYQSSIVRQGLLGAGLLAAVVVMLLAVGGRREERRGATVAALLAAFVVLVPIMLAALGRDYVVPRNFTPAWVPLAVVMAAACTAPRTLPVGAALAAALLGAFVWAGIRIDRYPQYQRPNWRGVAHALGRTDAPRAIVAYDSGFASEPLSIYLPRVPWPPPPSSGSSIGELDIVGSTWQTLSRPLPAGVKLLGSRTVDDFLVARFTVPASSFRPSALVARATALLGPAPPSPAVLLQRPTP